MKKIQKTLISELNIQEQPLAVVGFSTTKQFYLIADYLYKTFDLDLYRIHGASFFDEHTHSANEFDSYIYNDERKCLCYMLVRNNQEIELQSDNKNAAPTLFETLNTKIIHLIEVDKSVVKKPDYILFIVGRDCKEKAEELVNGCLDFCTAYIMQYKDKQLPQKINSAVEQAEQSNSDIVGKKSPYDSIKAKREQVRPKSVVFSTDIRGLMDDWGYNFLNEDIRQQLVEEEISRIKR